MSSYYEKILATGEVKCIDEEIPFEVPNGWEWCRLSCLTSILGDGIHGTPEYDNAGDIYFVNGNNLNDGIITIKDDTKRVNSTEAAKHKRTLTESTVLVSINGTIGKVAFYNNEKIILGKSACYFNLLGCINKVYVKCIIETEYFSEYAKKVATGTTIKNVPLAGMRNFLIPLPSLSEQSRIVHRINELKKKVSRYNHLQSELDILNRSIFDKLKRSALQEAVQGRLVPQIAEEGTAQELLDQIQAEKQRLVKEGKLKKSALTSSVIYKGDDNKYYENDGNNIVCIDDEIPFVIPTSWQWVRLEHICSYIQRGKSPKYSPIEQYPVVAQKCNQWTGFTIEKAQFIDPATIGAYTQERFLEDGDLMWNSTGLGTLGRMAIYWEELNPYKVAVADSHVTVIRPLKSFVMPQYLYSYFSSYTVQSVIEDKADGSTKQKELATTTVKKYLVPLPPFADQIRIVEKIKEVTSIMRI